MSNEWKTDFDNVTSLNVGAVGKGCLTLLAVGLIVYLVAVLVYVVGMLSVRQANYDKWLATRPEGYSITLLHGIFWQR